MRKVWLVLDREGIPESRRTVERARDSVNGDFASGSPDRLRVADMTSVAAWSEWVYVAFVIDAFARRIRVRGAAPRCRHKMVLEVLEPGCVDPPARSVHVLGLRSSVTGCAKPVCSVPWATYCSRRCLLPRTATVSLACLIAEIGPLLERCDNPEQVAALCGAAPVTKASGKSRTVGFRYTANKQARVAITSFADNSRHS